MLSGCGAKPGGSNCFTMWHWGAKVWGPAWINHRLLGCHHIPWVWLWWVPKKKLGKKGHFGFSIFFLKCQHCNCRLPLTSGAQSLCGQKSTATWQMRSVSYVKGASGDRSILAHGIMQLWTPRSLWEASKRGPSLGQEGEKLLLVWIWKKKPWGRWLGFHWN